MATKDPKDLLLDAPNLNYDLAMRVLEAQFPDQLASYPGVIEKSSWLQGANGDFDPKTNRIRVAPKDDAFNTSNVMNLVGTGLHEIQHYQQDTPQGLKNNMSGATGLLGKNNSVGQFTKERSQLRIDLINSAAALNFSSVDPRSTYTLDEILATTVPVALMNARGITTKHTEKAAALEAKFPDMADLTKRNQRPDLPTLESFEPSIPTRIKEAVQSIFSLKQK